MTELVQMHFALASDHRYADGLHVAIASLLAHSDKKRTIHLHVLDGGLTTANKELVEKIVSGSGRPATLDFTSIDGSMFQGVRLLQDSPLTYARLALPEIFPDLDEIIYGDVDVLYGADVFTLWDLDCSPKAAAAVVDSIFPTLDGDAPWLDAEDPDRSLPYFNAGVMKINLAYWRTHSIGKQALVLAQKDPDKCKCWDQTILNHLLRGMIAWAPRSLNWLAEPGATAANSTLPIEGTNIHYICPLKPWMRYSRAKPSAMWRKGFARLVPAPARYRLSWRFWGGYVWGEWVAGGPLAQPISRLMLSTGAFRLVPGLSARSLRAHLQLPEEGGGAQ